MSLSEKDREILLQEIQQIQKTLEETGRNFGPNAKGLGPYSDSSSEEEEDEEEEDNGNDNQSYYNSFVCKKEEEYEDPYSQIASAYGYAGANYNNELNGTVDQSFKSELQNGTYSFEDGNSLATSMSLDYLQSSRVDGEKILTKSIAEIPESSINPSVKRRIREESLYGRRSGRSTPLASRSTSRSPTECSSLGSNTKQKRRNINMANLYVERLFGGFKKKKSAKSNCFIDADGYRYGTRDLKSSANLSTLENMLQVNRRYQELLAEEIIKIELAITRNRRAQEEVSTTIEHKDIKNMTFSSLNKACIGRFSSPYFKDNEGLGPPNNEDTIQKKRNYKMNPFTRTSKDWKKQETDALENGVYHYNLGKRLEPWLKKLKEFDKSQKDRVKKGLKKKDPALRTRITQEIANVKALSRSEIIQDPSQIDFFWICKNYLPSRDEFECHLQWCNVIHPSINQNKFTRDEDSQLIKLAKKYKNFQWERIAEELGTKRTPVQCLQRFQRTLNKEMIKTTWEEEDDEQLTEAVREHGNNWVLVASVLGNRTGDQCMHRWEKTVNPNIKRGRWDKEEDEALIAAVELYGASNWKKVKYACPGRTDAQCRERYVSTLDPDKDWSAFTEEEDKKIIDLVNIHGLGKWTQVAKEFPGRRDNQIWRRYMVIEADKYHKYRRSIIWKRKSVLNYFFHRPSERRDYSLEELDVNYSPLLTNQESKKLERARQELERIGYTQEEITKRLARMHYEGMFSRTDKKPRQQGKSRFKRVFTVRNQKSTDYQDFADRQLISQVKDVISTVSNPTEDLPPLPTEQLNLRKKGKAPKFVLNDDGLLIIPRRKIGMKRGRKETWWYKKIDGDIFRRKCEELIKKFKLRQMWYTEVKQKIDHYYSIIQEAGNSFYHKTILHVYTDESEKLEELYKLYIEMQVKIITQDYMTLLVVEDEEQPKRRRGRPRRIEVDAGGNRTPAVKPCNVKIETVSAKKYPSRTSINQMVAEEGSAITDSYTGENGVVTQPIVRVKKERIDTPVNSSKRSSSITKTITEVPVNDSEETTPVPPRKSRGKSSGKTGATRNRRRTKTFKQMVAENSRRLDHAGPTPSPVQSPPVRVKVEVSESPSGQQGIASQIQSPHHAGYALTDGGTPVHHANTSNFEMVSHARTPNVNSTEIRSHVSTPRVETFDNNNTSDATASHNHTPFAKSNSYVPTSNVGTLTGNVPSPRVVVPTCAPSSSSTAANGAGSSTINQGAGSSHQGPSHPSSSTGQHPQTALNDQLKTFTLLLQALHVDTAGVLSNLNRNVFDPSQGNTSAFPTCYPLSPNVSTMLGFRKLLLHRRALGEIVKQHVANLPEERDLSYRDSEAHDILKKRFRSLFSWPAFLATFVPKYVETPNVEPPKDLDSVLQKMGGKSVHGQVSETPAKSPSQTAKRKYVRKENKGADHRASKMSTEKKPRKSIEKIAKKPDGNKAVHFDDNRLGFNVDKKGKNPDDSLPEMSNARKPGGDCDSSWQRIDDNERKNLLEAFSNYNFNVSVRIEDVGKDEKFYNHLVKQHLESNSSLFDDSSFYLCTSTPLSANEIKNIRNKAKVLNPQDVNSKTSENSSSPPISEIWSSRISCSTPSKAYVMRKRSESVDLKALKAVIKVAEEKEREKTSSGGKKRGRPFGSKNLPKTSENNIKEGEKLMDGDTTKRRKPRNDKGVKRKVKIETTEYEHPRGPPRKLFKAKPRDERASSTESIFIPPSLTHVKEEEDTDDPFLTTETIYVSE